MAEYSSHAPGTFCWPELATTDQKSAVSFYRSLFGWEVNEQPIGPTETYSIFQIRGKDVGAAYTMRAEERQHGAPPHWNAYVTVANADETANRAKALRAIVLAPPFDVMDSGRMAILQDPTGAVFQIWQPKNHIGAKLLREPGALTWTELATRDPEAAKTFYTSLFGWKEKTSTGGGMTYTEFSIGDAPFAGMMEMNAQMVSMNVPPNWLTYFEVADVDATANKAAALGAKLAVPPMDIPNTGRFSVIQDPHGAVFAIYKSAR
jgi:predicted enzyme related to lactoylglutathione lyase